MKNPKRIIIGLLVLLAVQTIAIAGSKKPVALSGYDVVSYFTRKKATKGKSRIQARYNGYFWNFSSSIHKMLFEKNPNRYIPRYGGHCAWAMAEKNELVES